MINNPAYKKLKTYCENQNLTKSQVEAITKQQVETVAGVSVGNNFFNNVKRNLKMSFNYF